MLDLHGSDRALLHEEFHGYTSAPTFTLRPEKVAG